LCWIVDGSDWTLVPRVRCDQVHIRRNSPPRHKSWKWK
jgi:hypothetical protein